MTIIKLELLRGRTSLIIWSLAIAFVLGLCIVIYPQMSEQMGDISSAFASMGDFSAAFGMDRINYGEFNGYFGIECGNILGLGGAFFAALLGVSALAKEQKEHTAEFLLTHPIKRSHVAGMKLLAVMIQVVILNLVSLIVCAVSTAAIGEEFFTKSIMLMLLSYLIMHIEIAALTFGISAFIKRGSLGIGIGLAAGFYFMNIISNLIDETKFLKYITPFAYTESADIITNGKISMEYLACGIAFGVIAVICAFVVYTKKDIS